MILSLFVGVVLLAFIALLFAPVRNFFRPLLILHRKRSYALGLLFLLGAVSMIVTGCAAPTWLTDAQGIVALVAASITSVGGFIASLTGNAALAQGLAVVQKWIAEVQTGLTDLEQLIDQYNAEPTTGLLLTIKATLADVTTNIQQDFSNLGLPAGVLNVVAGVAAVALSQLTAWGSLLPAGNAVAMAKFTVITPYTKKQYKELINNVLSQHTGDAEIDAALAQAKKL